MRMIVLTKVGPNETVLLEWQGWVRRINIRAPDAALAVRSAAKDGPVDLVIHDHITINDASDSVNEALRQAVGARHIFHSERHTA